MSIKGDIFKAIGEHLMSKLQFTEPIDGIILPNLQWYDKDFGQAKLIQDGIISLPLPAILISFKTPTWVSRLSRMQTGETVLRIRILFENYADSFSESINQDKAIQFFEYSEKVHKALEGFEGDYFTGLNRASDDEDDDHNNVIVTDIFYSTLITDDSADMANSEELVTPTAKSVQQTINRPETNTDHHYVIP